MFGRHTKKGYWFPRLSCSRSSTQQRLTHAFVQELYELVQGGTPHTWTSRICV